MGTENLQRGKKKTERSGREGGKERASRKKQQPPKKTALALSQEKNNGVKIYIGGGVWVGDISTKEARNQNKKKEQESLEAGEKVQTRAPRSKKGGLAP